MNLFRLRNVVRKEILSLRRDPLRLRMLIVAPIAQLLVFGYVATTDVRDVPVGVCDLDMSPASRQLISQIEASRYFTLEAAVLDPRDLEGLLERGRAQVTLTIPRDFERDMRRGETPRLALHVDGSDSNTAGVGTAYLTGLLRRFQEGWAEENLRRRGWVTAERSSTAGTVPSGDSPLEAGGSMSAGTAPSRASGASGDSPLAAAGSGALLSAEPRVWYNVDLSSVNYMVPGVFGLVLLVITLNLASLTVVRQRENGTLEQLLVTPLKPSEFLAGSLLPLGVAAMLDAGIIVLLALYWFNVPFRGSYVLLFVCAAVFLVANMATGLLVSVLTRTQQEAQITTFLLAMPSILLSGFMFPIANMPPLIQALTYAIPFRYFLEITRGLFLRGVGMEILWPQMLALALFAGGLTALSIRVMAKRL